ncbi:hypothetical protein [Microvirga alba]|uniref:Uncharacterized protein n=1 Tax=Microvirga alba TaxID=2791025 RepID=A0A931BLJ7_9HYPH|nr:hypothetical protein [Microvirga alba]MBF9233476.1 hypothetical protein [Microvirga alba]
MSSENRGDGFPTMTDEDTLVTFSNADYDAIEAAVLETARGRWFLREYAKRNRNADTQTVLAAVNELKEAVIEDQTARTMSLIKADLQDMVSAVQQTRHEIVSPDIEHQTAEERIRRMVQTLRYLEGRIHAMIAICDPELSRAEEEEPLSDAQGLAEAKTAYSSARPHFLM